MITTLTTKEQFDSLTSEAQEKVLFILEDEFTEDLVWIKLEGNNFYGVLDVTSCEAMEYPTIQFCNKSELLAALKG